MVTFWFQNPLQQSFWVQLPTLKKKEEKKPQMSEMFPGLDKATTDKIVQHSQSFPIEQRQQVQNDIYRRAIEQKENENNQQQRVSLNNNLYQQSLKEKDPERKKIIQQQVRANDFADGVKNMFWIPANTSDEEVMTAFFMDRLDLVQPFTDYINWKNEDILFELWLKERPEDPIRWWWVKGTLSSFWQDMLWWASALDWMNVVGKATETVDDLVQQIPTMSEDQRDKFAKEKLWWFGEWMGMFPTMMINAIPSFIKTVSAIWRWITNPVDTVSWLVSLVATEEWHEIIKERYGWMQQLRKTMTEDPVWLASDILTIGELWAWGIKLWTKAAWLSETSAKIGKFADTARTASNLWVDELIRAGYKTLDDLAKDGNKFATVWQILVYPTRPLSVISKLKWNKSVPVERESVNYTAPAEITTTPGLNEMILKSIKTTVVEKKWAKVVEKFNKSMVSSIDSVLQYADEILLPDEQGNLINRKIEWLRDFGDALQQTKEMIFKEYDSLKKQAGEAGLEVKTDNIVKQLEEMKQWLDKMIWQQNTVKYIDNQIADLRRISTMSVEEAQKNMQYFNQKNQAYYRNPDPNNIGNAMVDVLINNNIKQAMNEWITSTVEQWWAYSVLKKKYADILWVEKEVNKRATVSWRWNSKWLMDLTDMYSASEAVSALWKIAMWNIWWAVADIAQWWTVKLIKEFFKRSNDPNNVLNKLIKEIQTNRNKYFTIKDIDNVTPTNTSSNSTIDTISTKSNEVNTETPQKFAKKTNESTDVFIDEFSSPASIEEMKKLEDLNFSPQSYINELKDNVRWDVLQSYELTPEYMNREIADLLIWDIKLKDINDKLTSVVENLPWDKLKKVYESVWESLRNDSSLFDTWMPTRDTIIDKLPQYEVANTELWAFLNEMAWKNWKLWPIKILDKEWNIRQWLWKDWDLQWVDRVLEKSLRKWELNDNDVVRWTILVEDSAALDAMSKKLQSQKTISDFEIRPVDEMWYSDRSAIFTARNWIRTEVQLNTYGMQYAKDPSLLPKAVADAIKKETWVEWWLWHKYYNKMKAAWVEAYKNGTVIDTIIKKSMDYYNIFRNIKVDPKTLKVTIS